MYCRKCGKWIDGDAEICFDCQQNEELFKVENEEPAQPMGQNTQQQYYNPSAQQQDWQQPYQQSGWQQPYQQQGWQQPPQPQNKGNRMEGFGLALAGAIVSEFAIVFSYLFMVLVLAGGMGGFVMFPFAVGTAIFTLISGIKSLKTSKACVNAGKVKPIATFILGIINVVGAGLSFFFIFLTLMGTMALV